MLVTIALCVAFTLAFVVAIPPSGKEQRLLAIAVMILCGALLYGRL